jgi:prepilin-type N-terminal cleavage/methylation domain-containing protein
MVHRRAFTLFELTSVITIIAILSAFAIIAISAAMRGIQISAATSKLASDIKYAQTMASGTGKWYGISFEADPGNLYTLYTTTGTIDTVIENPAKLGSNFIVNTSTDFTVLIGTVNIEGANKIEFSPLGTPYKDRTASALTQEAVILLTKGGSSRSVRIFPTTGRVAIQ